MKNTELVVLNEEGELDNTLVPMKKQEGMKKAAIMLYAGENIKDIAKQCGVASSTVSKWLNSAFCKDMLSKFHNSDREFIKAKIRRVLPAMCDAIINDIEDNTDNKYRAIDKVFKLYDLEGKTSNIDSAKQYKELFKALYADDEDDVVTIEVNSVESLPADQQE